MNTKRILILTVLIDAILSIASFLIDARGFAVRDPRYLGVDTAIRDSVALLFFGLLAVGWVGIVRFWNPGRYCYLAAWAITLMNYTTADSYQAPGWLYTLYNIVAITGGIIIALIFFSDLRGNYRNTTGNPTETELTAAEPS